MILVILVILIGAVLGGSLASFATLLAYRLRHGASVVRPGSTCASCATPIAWHDNVPVVSFLALAGRCRTCRTALPMSAFVLDIAGVVTGALVTYAALRT